jgi:hypothetical protein
VHNYLSWETLKGKKTQQYETSLEEDKPITLTVVSVSLNIFEPLLRSALRPVAIAVAAVDSELLLRLTQNRVTLLPQNRENCCFGTEVSTLKKKTF